MCTLTIIPLVETGRDEDARAAGRGECQSPGTRRGFRVVMNRDEQRTRPACLPPRTHRLPDGVTGLWPTDTQAGGTWIAGSSRGLVLGLLNIYPDPGHGPAPIPASCSRGTIIPALIGLPNALAAVEALSDMNLSGFAGFRLVAVDLLGVFECRWDAGLTVVRSPLAALCFSSHGWGDGRAKGRLELFERLSRGHSMRPHDQDLFHHHQWPEHPGLSVLMSRDDARTVSITGVRTTVDEAGGIGVTMDHDDDSGSHHAALGTTEALASACPGAGGAGAW